MLTASEHDVLEQMSESGFTDFLVLGADVIPHVDRNDWSLVVFMNENGQSVIEDEFLIRNVDVSGVRGGCLFGGGGFVFCRRRGFRRSCCLCPGAAHQCHQKEERCKLIPHFRSLHAQVEIADEL
jgi:hypothetical protein